MDPTGTPGFGDWRHWAAARCLCCDKWVIYPRFSGEWCRPLTPNHQLRDLGNKLTFTEIQWGYFMEELFCSCVRYDSDNLKRVVGESHEGEDQKDEEKAESESWAGVLREESEEEEEEVDEEGQHQEPEEVHSSGSEKTFVMGSAPRSVKDEMIEVEEGEEEEAAVQQPQDNAEQRGDAGENDDEDSWEDSSESMHYRGIPRLSDCWPLWG